MADSVRIRWLVNRGDVLMSANEPVKSRALPMRVRLARVSACTAGIQAARAIGTPSWAERAASRAAPTFGLVRSASAKASASVNARAGAAASASSTSPAAARRHVFPRPIPPVVSSMIRVPS